MSYFNFNNFAIIEKVINIYFLMPRQKNFKDKWAQNIKYHQNIHRNVGTSPIPQQKNDIGTKKNDFIDFNMKTLVFLH